MLIEGHIENISLRVIRRFLNLKSNGIRVAAVGVCLKELRILPIISNIIVIVVDCGRRIKVIIIILFVIVYPRHEIAPDIKREVVSVVLVSLELICKSHD